MANQKTKVSEKADELDSKVQQGADEASHKVKRGADEASSKAKEGANEASDKIKQGADKASSKVQEGAEKASKVIQDGADKVEEVVHSEDFQRASQRAEEEVNKLKTELADLKRKAGPKIQEAENYLTSPSAVTFYKGLITGVALVLAFKRYSERR